MDKADEEGVLQGLQKETEEGFWGSWTYIKTPVNEPFGFTQYAAMAVGGILILIGMKLAVDYIKREIRRYEEEHDMEEASREITEAE